MQASVSQYALGDNNILDDLRIEHSSNDDVRTVFVDEPESSLRMDDSGAEDLVGDPGR